jgi:hypothetical protein
VDIGVARGWNVWPLENGNWAWNVWDHLHSRSGTEHTEANAQEAAQRELQRIIAEAKAAAQQERELTARDDRRKYWDPQS